MHSLSENDFIHALKSGDTNAYTHLVDVHHHKLSIYAYGLVRNYDTAEDIVQNVFFKVWNKRENLKEGFSIQAFLYKSVYNEFINYYKKHKMIFPLEKKFIDGLTSIVEDEDTQELERLLKIVRKEIDNLPSKCREIFLMSKEEGLTNLEIAEYKDISLKNVEAHINRAFTILKDKIGDKAEGILFLLFGQPNNYEV